MLKKRLFDTLFRRTILLLIAIVFSITVLSPIMTNPKTHSASMNVIKASKEQATALSVTVTLASSAISLLPDDTASPIADELSELSTPLFLIVCVLYFEQFMLTSMEFVAFSILVPLACTFFIGSMLLQRKSLKIIGYKLLLIGLLCAIIIPISAGLTNMIRQAYAESFNSIQLQLNDINEVFSQISINGSDGDILDFFSNLASGIGEVLELAKNALGLLIDGIAILMVTSCIIPVITVLVFVWTVKSIISGKMENFEDIAIAVTKRIPRKEKRQLAPADDHNGEA